MERQIAVCSGILVQGETQGHFVLQDPPRLLAASFVAMEDGYQMEVLAGRRTRTEVIAALYAYARAVTGHDLSERVTGPKHHPPPAADGHRRAGPP
ncbi:hypothetical protein [Streptomyces sp. NBC_00354]|uniref:hypothetical protein n=1 Tax=Streptomyces sp. NBC_00354 TaxID=2975723 RepID=UPI002E257EE6